MRRVAVAAMLVLAVGCAGDESGGGVADGPASTESIVAPANDRSSSTSTIVPDSTTTTDAPTTSTSTTTTSTSTSTTSTTAVVATTTVVATVPDTAPVDVRPGIDVATFPLDAEIEIGRSVEGRPITVIRRGDPTGARVLAIGVIHGNESDGVAVIDQLAVAPVPAGVELWLVRSMNPDGQAIGDRQNANGVDLNRNFPENWGALGEPGFWQYGGTGPASEPETQAVVTLGETIRPDAMLWYHQDLFRIAPGSGRSAEIRSRYAELAGLPIVDITGGTYTGTASQWSRTILPENGVGITVELGPTVSQAEIEDHVAAVHAIATEYF